MHQCVELATGSPSQFSWRSIGGSGSGPSSEMGIVRNSDPQSGFIFILIFLSFSLLLLFSLSLPLSARWVNPAHSSLPRLNSPSHESFF